MQQLTPDQFLEHLAAIAKPTRLAWAMKHKVDPAHLSRVLNGRDDPRPKLIEAAGFERLTFYRKRAVTRPLRSHQQEI